MTKQTEFEQLKQENERLKNLLKIQEDNEKTHHDIEDLIDTEKLKEIFMKFSKLTGYTTGFVKQDTREILISTGWTEICKTFHRGSESSAHICQESNAELTQNLKESHQISMKQCHHGMVDGATPIIIDGQHLADLFSGQVLFQAPNIEEFKRGAQEFGYDIESYMKALQEVKIISQDKLKEVLEFLSTIAQIIAEIGKDKKEYLKLNNSLEKKVQERMKEKESLLKLFDESDNVLFKWNNDPSLSVAFVSRSISKLLGYSKSDFETNKIHYISCIYPQDRDKVLQEIDRASLQKETFFAHKPYRVITKNKQIKWILENSVIIRDDNDVITHYLGYLSDITEFKNYQETLEKLSQTDQLTQVKNRLFIDQTLQKQHYRFVRNGEKCSIILIDIDHFKDVNDTYGHITGDVILIEFAKILSQNLRKSDVIGRWGGEEFLIILPHTEIEKAQQLAQKLKKLIESFHFTKIKHKTASFGISEFRDGTSIEQLLENADKALYLSKENGRNQIHTVV